jgi:CO/xanthine dehydrogenase Mo-binding subunit
LGHAAGVGVEIDAASKKLHIRRVVEAWEPGPVVNSNGLRNQIMGATVQAIDGALFERILFADSRILNPHFA